MANTNVPLFPGQNNPDNIRLRNPLSSAIAITGTGALAIAVSPLAATGSQTVVGGGMRSKTFYWIPSDTGKRWVLRTMEPDEMVVLASALALDLPTFVTLYVAAEEGALAA